MNRLLSEPIARAAFVALSASLIASQHLVVWALTGANPSGDSAKFEFWLTPLRSGLGMPHLTPLLATLLFAFGVAVAWGLASLSFWQARRTGRGYPLAILSVVPVVQLAAIPMLALLPTLPAGEEAENPDVERAAGVVHGLLAGIAIVVLAVLISAVTFGAYGWGLFVATPFLVGVTTGFLVNRREDLGGTRTMLLTAAAAGLGSLALVFLALEGAICIILAAPLAVPIVILGGALGRKVAVARLTRSSPLASVAVLPLIFMLEGAIPAEARIATAREIDIQASPAAVWAALISAEPIRARPGLTAVAGLAYPVGGHLERGGLGAVRSGTFSTGVAREVVTGWQPGRLLAFRVLSQPPAMEEMSPYRRVHAPHLVGYFETGETRFELLPLAKGGTRLKVAANHRLRIEPIPYWEPIARWAIRTNVDRVLQDVRAKAVDPHG